MTVDRSKEHIEPHDGKWVAEHWCFHLRTPRARKPHACHGCGEPIEKGSRHVCYVTTGIEGPGMETWHLHGECYLEDGPMFDSDRPEWRWCPRD